RVCCVCCFFFQAEDGIRDGHVTGVQTCALPISLRRARAPEAYRDKLPAPAPFARPVPRSYGSPPAAFGTHAKRPQRTATVSSPRSEERRVGKECKAGR